MRRLLLPLVLLLALVASACGGSEPTAEQVSPDAIVLAASKTKEAGTYKADVTATMDIAGQSIDMSGTGAFDGTNQRGHMSYAMNLNGQDVDMEMVFAYPVVYMELPAESGALPGGKTWIKMDFEKLGQQAGFDFEVASDHYFPWLSAQYCCASVLDRPEVRFSFAAVIRLMPIVAPPGCRAIGLGNSRGR